MKVSVLIIVHDRPAHLRACLHALALQSRRADQVVVVDDGSSPAAFALIRQIILDSRLPVQLVARERTAYCPAAARNEAVRHADHEYVLFLDCDIMAFPRLVECHLTSSSPGAFLIGNCGLLDEVHSKVFLNGVDWGAAEFELAWQNAEILGVKRASKLFDRQSFQRRIRLVRRHKPKLLSGHFSLYRDDLFLVNGFDENYVGWGYEDDDLGMRLYSAGVNSRSVIEQARAMHLWHPSLAPQELKRHRDRPNRAYFRRWRVPAYCQNGLK